MTDTKKAPVLKAQIMKTLKGLPTKSAQIRYLDSQNVPRADISRIMTKLYGKLVRYQHVRNVLITPVGKNTSV